MTSLRTVTGTSSGSSTSTSDSAVRELMAVREIVHAFLTADNPRDVFQFALERVSPLVGATFACVYLIDGASELMPLVAAYNWPERYRPFLGDMKVRLGFGPSGEAASERRAIEVPDVFADPSLEDWQEVATEMGFQAIVALPLQSSAKVLGTVTFYFDSKGGFSADARSLLRLVADQMAATAEKASLIEELRRANAALVDTNAELERQYMQALEARRVKDEFLANVSHELRTPLTAVIGYTAIMEEGIAGPVTGEQAMTLRQVKGASERLLELIDNLLDLTTLKRGDTDVQIETFDPREPLNDAVVSTGGRAQDVELRIDQPDTMLPEMRSDRRKVAKILSALLNNAYKFTSQGEVRITLDVRSGRVVYVVQDTGLGIEPDMQVAVFEEFRQADGSMTRRYGGSGLGLSLARGMAHLLGGDIDLSSIPGDGSTFTVELPLDVAVQSDRHRVLRAD
jgi:signal transduction histidine kinase